LTNHAIAQQFLQLQIVDLVLHHLADRNAGQPEMTSPTMCASTQTRISPASLATLKAEIPALALLTQSSA